MDNLVISHMTLRKVLGFLGLLFPVILFSTGLFSNSTILISLSAYHWSNAGIIFSSFLIAFGVFLLSYKGYDRMDELITSVSGISMIGTAVFPTFGGSLYLFSFLNPITNFVLHFVFATIAFTSLGVMSYFQFTKTSGNMTKEKQKRNIVYKACGIVIFASIALMIPVKFFGLFEQIRLFLVLEALVVIAFGFSWLVKGEAIFKDNNLK